MREIVVSNTEVVTGLVSTIIPVYNRPILVREAITSVLRQTYRPIEIIVVDDGSTDETVGVLQMVARENANDVRVLRQRNTGPGVAREAGTRGSRGEFIQYLDSDDLLLPRKFEWQVEGLRARLDCGVSYGMTRSYCFGEEPLNEAIRRTGEKIETMFPSFLKCRWWSTSTPLYRRKVVDAAGPWATLWNEEDWEFDCRVAALGAKLHYLPEFVSDRRLGGTDHLCTDGGRDPAKLRDRAKAHCLIYEHARRFGISLGAPEMRHFARELFLLSRQCGGAGLVEESAMLFGLARTATEPHRRSTVDFICYQTAARMLGWRTVGMIARALDECKSAIGRTMSQFNEK